MPNQIVTVTKADKSQNGKDRVFFDGKHDYRDAYYLSRGIDLPPLNVKIEVQTHSWTPGEGKQTFWYLDKWRLAEQPTPVAQPTLPPMAPPTPAPKANGGWDVQSGDLSRFVSNVVASAIEKGLINDPDEIFTWTAAAYRAGNQLRTGKVQDFNDMKLLPLSEEPPTEISDEDIPF